MNKNKGISLIVLVITIVVIVILAGAVVLALAVNNPITQANKATYLSDVRNFQTELELYKTKQFSDKLGAYDPNLLQADDASITYNGVVTTDQTIHDLIPSLGRSTKYNGQFQVIEGQLIYGGLDTNKQDWTKESGLEVVIIGEPKVTILPPSQAIVQPGTDAIYTIKFSSNASLKTIDLVDKLEVLNDEGIALPVQPVITLGTITGTEVDAIRQTTVNIKTDNLVNGTYKLRIKPGVVTNANNITNSQETISLIGFDVLDEIPPENPQMSADKTEWTNENVLVTITFSEDTKTKEYSLDTTTWNSYTGPVVVTENNTTVYARGKDLTGNESGVATITIANIDKVAPTIEATNDGSTTSSVRVNAIASDEGGSGIAIPSYQYSKDNGVTWTSSTNETYYVFNELTSGTYECKVKVMDNAGNSTVSNMVTITTIGLGTIGMSATPTSWTNGDVEVTINYPPEIITKQYSLNGTDWNTYTSNITVTSNLTVYARGYDAGNNQTTQASTTVANIDKVAPTVTATNDGSTTSSVRVNAIASDTGGSVLNASSYQYSKDNGVTWTSAINQTYYVFTGLTSGTYECKVKVMDNAGNSAVSNMVTIATTGLGTIGMSATPTSWTNGNVTVTINYPSEVVTKQYSLNGTTWNTYTSAVVVTTNGTVYARGYDAGNNQTSQASITISNIDKTVPVVTNSLSGGMIYTDQKFQSGINSTFVYNNLGNGTVTNTRIAMPDSPTGSGYGLEVRTTGTPSPGWGGFYFANPTSANKVFITKIIASIPVGYTINWASNQFGDGGTAAWLTSQAGTGTWQEYVCKVNCGASGTFSSTNFYFLTGGITPTPSSPLVWRVAYATIFDTTLWKSTSNAMVSATDTSGIVGYGINQSSVTQPTYTSISAKVNFATVLENISTNGTYYVWLKDQAGNITNTPITVNNIDNVSPTVSYGTNGSSGTVTASTTVAVSDTGGSNLNTSTLQYVWDTQNSIAPSSGWTTFTNGTTLTRSGTGTYYLWIKGTDNAGNSIVSKSNAFTIATAVSQVFDYIGNVQTWIVPYTANYQLEVWGAQGGNGADQSNTLYGGLGGYSKGIVYLSAGQTIYIYVGGAGIMGNGSANITGGYNGGGTAVNNPSNATSTNMIHGSGGGATDIRLTGTNLSNRIIVAGGGGGAGGCDTVGYATNGGAGGGTNGLKATDSITDNRIGGGGGTQSSGGTAGTYASNGVGTATNGSLGQGGTSGSITQNYYLGGAGGGGYYGGGGGAPGGPGGGGGSGYIGGVTSGQIIAGNASMPNPSGGTMVGKTGNGYVKITSAP